MNWIHFKLKVMINWNKQLVTGLNMKRVEESSTGSCVFGVCFGVCLVVAGNFKLLSCVWQNKLELEGKEWHQTENREKHRDAVKLVRMLTKEKPKTHFNWIPILPCDFKWPFLNVFYQNMRASLMYLNLSSINNILIS